MSDNPHNGCHSKRKLLMMTIWSLAGVTCRKIKCSIVHLPSPTTSTVRCMSITDDFRLSIRGIWFRIKCLCANWMLWNSVILTGYSCFRRNFDIWQIFDYMIGKGNKTQLNCLRDNDVNMYAGLGLSIGIEVQWPGID